MPNPALTITLETQHPDTQPVYTTSRYYSQLNFYSNEDFWGTTGQIPTRDKNTYSFLEAHENLLVAMNQVINATDVIGIDQQLDNLNSIFDTNSQIIHNLILSNRHSFQEEGLNSPGATIKHNGFGENGKGIFWQAVLYCLMHRLYTVYHGAGRLVDSRLLQRVDRTFTQIITTLDSKVGLFNAAFTFEQQNRSSLVALAIFEGCIESALLLLKKVYQQAQTNPRVTTEYLLGGNHTILDKLDYVLAITDGDPAHCEYGKYQGSLDKYTQFILLFRTQLSMLKPKFANDPLFDRIQDAQTKLSTLHRMFLEQHKLQKQREEQHLYDSIHSKVIDLELEIKRLNTILEQKILLAKSKGETPVQSEVQGIDKMLTLRTTQLEKHNTQLSKLRFLIADLSTSTSPVRTSSVMDSATPLILAPADIAKATNHDRTKLFAELRLRALKSFEKFAPSYSGSIDEAKDEEAVIAPRQLAVSRSQKPEKIRGSTLFKPNVKRERNEDSDPDSGEKKQKRHKSG